jgi:hypothetical protein
LTNAVSKKIENHAHSVALMMTFYNFVRIHETLRVTPATAAGVTDRLREVADIVALMDAAERGPNKRGSYRTGSPSDESNLVKVAASIGAAILAVQEAGAHRMSDPFKVAAAIGAAILAAVVIWI